MPALGRAFLWANFHSQAWCYLRPLSERSNPPLRLLPDRPANGRRLDAGRHRRGARSDMVSRRFRRLVVSPVGGPARASSRAAGADTRLISATELCAKGQKSTPLHAARRSALLGYARSQGRLVAGGGPESGGRTRRMRCTRRSPALGIAITIGSRPRFLGRQYARNPWREPSLDSPHAAS